MSQKTQIKAHLEKGLPISPMMALKHYKVMRLAARIEELRKDGLPINSEKVRSPDGARYAVYRMGA